MMNPLRRAVRSIGRVLARFGVVDGDRAVRTADLAWPRIVTGLARSSQRVVDFAMIGAVLGPPALAGVGFAFAFWRLGSTIGLGLGGGAISIISQRYGADDEAGIDVAIKASIWLSIALALPLTALFTTVPDRLIAPLAGNPISTAYGATYLHIVSLGMGLEFFNKVTSRVLVGAEDAWTPMLVRGGGATVNIVLNAIFIFGMGLGVVGAALGTLSATVLVTATFTWGLLTGGVPFVGSFPVGVRRRPPYFDRAMTWTLVRRAAPLMVRRVAQTLGRFPMLAIAATFGPTIVAGYEISRRVRTLLRTPNWGFSLAASSLVGQRLGVGDEATATAYGRDIFRFSFAVHLLAAAAAYVFAGHFARLFVSDPAALAATVPFVQVAAVGVLAVSLEGVANGVLKGGGDTRWPLYGKVLGLYGIGVPIAYLGTVSSIGVLGLYAALLAQVFVPAAVSTYRFQTLAWQTVDTTVADGKG